MYYRLTITLFLLFAISGCQTVYMTGVSKAVLIDKEERSFNNYVADTIILAQLKNEYFTNNENIFFFGQKLFLMYLFSNYVGDE